MPHHLDSMASARKIPKSKEKLFSPVANRARLAFEIKLVLYHAFLNNSLDEKPYQIPLLRAFWQ